jgi:heme/copper-type cytochrome/quinol oxidase subunit 2
VDGARIDWLIHFTVLASAIIFVLVGAMLLFSLIRHRRRHPAVYAPGSKASIGVVVGFVALVAVSVDGTLFLHTIADMKGFFWNFAAAEQHPDVVRIEVQAHQWAWQARYSGPDGKFNSPDDVVTLNDIRVPLGAPILVQLASRDVIHSFNLPHFRVKRDAVPGARRPIARCWSWGTTSSGSPVMAAPMCPATRATSGAAPTTSASTLIRATPSTRWRRGGGRSSATRRVTPIATACGG